MPQAQPHKVYKPAHTSAPKAMGPVKNEDWRKWWQFNHIGYDLYHRCYFAVQ
jgi:hypothetical protein